MTKPTPHGSAQGVVASLLEEIERGDLAPGDQIPTIALLADKYGVNKNTASKAVVALKELGVLSGLAGGNTWVRVPPQHKKRSNERYHAEKEAVRLPRSQRSSAGVSEADSGIPLTALYEDKAEYAVIAAPDDVREALGLPAGASVLRRVYTRRHAKGAGADRSISYLPYDLVSGNPDLLDATKEPWPGGTMHQLHTIGVELGKIVDHVTASMPTPEEVKDFDIPPRVPVIRIRKISYSTDGKPVELMDIPIPADRIELIYTTHLERWN
ncbi:transcriptional regulator [Streptomyces capoamus]|uniref:Transcriptional regulator n=1 Tax=Streptomyces capoamus TaxID=68183 RepID=A0A919F1Y6_9ACTN|nr:GntR family transcriptional regulator [Streptomyces capoamus]GGP32374.1 transcriptional regulator [Streptomyces libani subsp. rufus]GHG72641.1 transcriptional regulator [Streptomyces capoamus]